MPYFHDRRRFIYPAQVATSERTGKLRADVTSVYDNFPVPDATVRIFNINEPDRPIEVLRTDENGQTETIDLPAPDVEYSLAPSLYQPYAEYTVEVEAEGFDPFYVSGTNVLSEVTAIQNAPLMPVNQRLGEEGDLFVVSPHTLYQEYPPKIAESEIKRVDETGEIVLSRVVIPEFVIVHDGAPSDSTAKDYYVTYKDYIKNVASSEIYATWPESAIIANVLCIQSFVLNRVYTEWYRNKGYSFTITTSTAYDQKWMPGRNIFDTISQVVDEIFTNYLTRPNIAQPLFSQYCDGKRVTCPNWLSQWGSKSLADDGLTATQILKYYYGDNLYIESAVEVAGVPYSWPGAPLSIGSSGDNVRKLQTELNTISRGYPLIPKLAVDGVFGEQTAQAVRVFQQIFGLPQTGVVDYTTWYKISEIFVGVSRIAELV